MNSKRGKIEVLVESSIIYLVFALIVILLLELFVEMSEQQLFLLELLNLAIVIVFAIDLYFLYKHTHNVKHFLKKYWPDIVAIIPVAMITRIVAFSMGGLPFATTLGLFKIARLEKIFKIEFFKRYAKIAEVWKKVKVARTLRPLRAYDKFRLSVSQYLTKFRKKK